MEYLVQEYLDGPHLQSRRRTSTLLRHLLMSEIAPTARMATTGCRPDGFLMVSLPRAGRWLNYALFVALWVLSVRELRRGDWLPIAFVGPRSACSIQRRS